MLYSVNCIKRKMANDFQFKEELAILFNWLQNQPHLPIIETLPMKNFLIACNGNLDSAKSLIIKQYEMRNYYKALFIERDPSSDASRDFWNIADTILFPGLTSNCGKVIFMRLRDFDVSKYNFNDSIKMIIMFYDALLSVPDPSGIIPKEYICICDMTGYSLSHILKVSILTLRAFIKFYQEGISIKIKNIHIINCSDLINRIMTILTPLLNERVKKMIICHSPNTETIFDYVPKEMFPSDYNGNSKSIQELKDESWNQFETTWPYLIDRKYWEIDESKRIEPKSESWFGSFVKDFW
ncbi:alpha-tocopherol transfer protein-like [Condylostylus longicornis]|uniref:alpha-tocopherol transfer protein-like n=1 Tax=Condylostylus longicornis TaxID=2530218 RepID=UPI00244E3ED1|nr:alpha-tocopherol transfer protein-like [Condylostylus longicornis]